MWSSSVCSAGLKQMGYLEPTSFALVEKGQKGNENPLTVQCWMYLISQFTLCFAASVGTMLLCILKVIVTCHISIKQIQACSEEKEGEKVPLSSLGACKNRRAGRYYAALLVRDNLCTLGAVFMSREVEVCASHASVVICNRSFCFTHLAGLWRQFCS